MTTTSQPTPRPPIRPPSRVVTAGHFEVGLMVDPDLDDYGLTPNAFRLLAHLCRVACDHGATAYPPQVVCHKLRMSQPDMREAVKELQITGFLVVGSGEPGEALVMRLVGVHRAGTPE